MTRKGLHGTYFGGSTIIRVHPVGVEPRSEQPSVSKLIWTSDTPKSEAEANGNKIAYARLLKRADVNKLMHIRPKKRKFGITSCSKILYTDDVVERSVSLLGSGKKGFGEFAIATNSLLLQFGQFDLAEIAILFNKRGWKTLTDASWNATLVGVFIQRFGLLRSKVKVQKRKSKPKKLIRGSK